MSLGIDDAKPLEKHITICTEIEDLKISEFNDLLVYDDRDLKTKIRTCGDNVYTNFCGLNVAEDDVECEYFIIISTDSLLVYETNLTYKYI